MRTAANMKNVAGYERGALRRKERDGARDIVRRSEAAERRDLHERVGERTVPLHPVSQH